MKHLLLKSSLATLGLVIGVIAVVPVLVQAKESSDTDSSNRLTKDPERRTSREQEKAELDSTKSKVEDDHSEEGEDGDRKDGARERLKDTKLRVCTDRQENVNKIMDRVVDRSKAQVERISAVAEKAKAFYVKQGNILDTYDTLVSDVEAKKVLAIAAVDALDVRPAFSCESDGPKSDIADFNTDRLRKKVAVDDYRKAVKALIVGIKSVQPEKTIERGSN